MITVTERERKTIQNIIDKKMGIEELLDKLLMKTVPIKNKELLYEILNKYVKMNRLSEIWWEKMGKKYNFDYVQPHNINFKTGNIT